jgi:serine/threonine-protein kinase
MGLTIGTQLGSHEIIALLGKGGMGEVYRARDLKLKREVAIKILPDEFSFDTDRVSRFQREAEVLASLNHPNIAAIHDLEETNGTRYLVLELVEGETLADHIARGPIPVEAALKIAIQICEALEAAHEKGVIHRDLKPANVKVTADGKVKVLDFGLAKATAVESATPNLSNSPTMVSVLSSQPGMILGTASYMSPEQASGKPVDRRTDLWAFGVVLLEMLTGKTVFGGDTVSHVMAAVLMQEPDWAALPEDTPQPVRKLLRRCLEKDRRKRLPDAGAARLEIDEILQAPTPSGTTIPVERPEAGRRISWIPVVVALVLGALVGAGILFWTRPQTGVSSELVSGVARWTIGVRPAQALGGANSLYLYEQRPTRTSFTWSPDGRSLVFAGSQDGMSQLYMRQLDQLEAKPIPSTTGAITPFFSPDGRWIGFWSGASGELRKVPVAGGPAVTIAKVPIVYGASWGEDDEIYFDEGRGNIVGAGISRVSANAGAVEPVAAPDQSKGEYSYRLPQLLPGRKALLLTITTGGPQRAEDSKIAVRTLDGKLKQILGDGADARFVAPGYLVFVRRGALMAAPFDPKELKFTGGAVGILDNVMQSVPATGDHLDSAAGQFSVSSNGSLAYVQGGMFSEDRRSIVWVDRAGAVTPLPLTKRRYWGPHLSPDGRRFAVDTRGSETRIWVHDLETGTTTALTEQSSVATYPIWSPDSKRIVMNLTTGLFWRSSDGTGTLDRVPGSPDGNVIPSDWSPDGTHLAIVKDRSSFIFDLNGGAVSAAPLLNTSATVSMPVWSHDGRWIAYTSTDSGKSEVYVQPYPGPGPRVLVSRDGGGGPMWSRDGREIFYYRFAGSNSRSAETGRASVAVMAVPVSLSPTFTAGAPHTLFEGPYAMTGLARGFDVSPDGKRFLMVLPEDHPLRPASEITVVQNWIEELKRISATK